MAAALHRHVRRSREYLRDLAEVAQLRPSTLSERKDTTRSPSMRTVLAVAAGVTLNVELRDIDRSR